MTRSMDDGLASRLGLVVVNYGSHALVERNLATLDLAGLDTHVVVVDNRSTDEERDAIGHVGRSHGWEVVPLATNVGFGAAMNVGVDRALASDCTALVLLNPDLRIDVAVLRSLVDACRRDPGAMVSPRILRTDGSVWFAGGEVRLRDGRTVTTGASSAGRTGWLSGACLAVSAELWTRVGGFDPEYFLYWEDVDLSWRCTRAGGRLSVRPDLDAVHDVGGTQGPGKSLLYYRYNVRNRLVFAAKHLDGRHQIAWVLRSPAFARTVLRRGGLRGPRYRHLAPIWAVAAGTLEGLWFVIRHGSRQARSQRDVAHIAP
ncbi:glycosyltransferase family 2 protein [Actinotalea sp. K2]|uniref:glycosyltransferase family 2 protein n=1 Tax=Actinotalea sp. K2 TaxID=2939438 RepID=UPI00201829BF|nr:glycosyltransferase family 2 protein [Actinotalea sp. K2]MCL3861280.1 glycosyltransferase family 2 protein [Actinotalea sp. K2]